MEAKFFFWGGGVEEKQTVPHFLVGQINKWQMGKTKYLEGLK